MFTLHKYVVAHHLLKVLVENGACERYTNQESSSREETDRLCIYNVFNRRYPQYKPEQVVQAMDLLSQHRHIVLEEKEDNYAFIPFGYTAGGLEAYQHGWYQAAILKRSATITTALFIATGSIALGLLEWAAF